jgi:nicotinamide riboside transporter PnuC
MTIYDNQPRVTAKENRMTKKKIILLVSYGIIIVLSIVNLLFKEGILDAPRWVRLTAVSVNLALWLVVLGVVIVISKDARKLK